MVQGMHAKPLLCALLVAFLPAVVPPGAAGTADAPEVEDPMGDVAAEGIPVPAGLGAFDLLSIWFSAGDGTSIEMNMLMAEAPGDGFAGEVAAFLQVDDRYYHVGWTTLLPPVATPSYQGGFVCPSDVEGKIDPATCTDLAGARLDGMVFRIPLEAAAFGWAPGSLITIHEAYSDVWYLDVQLVLDRTAAGTPYTVPGAMSDAAQAGPGTTADALVAEAEDAGMRDGPSGTPAKRPVGEAGDNTGVAPFALVMAGVLLLVRRQARR